MYSDAPPVVIISAPGRGLPIIYLVVFRTIDVVAVPRLGSIAKIRILRLTAVDIIGELILVVLKILRSNQPQRSLEMWVQRKCGARCGYIFLCTGCVHHNLHQGAMGHRTLPVGAVTFQRSLERCRAPLRWLRWGPGAKATFFPSGMVPASD